jgi:hypothetical protein
MAIPFLKIPQKPFVGFARVFSFSPACEISPKKKKKKKKLIIIFLGFGLLFSFVTLIPLFFSRFVFAHMELGLHRSRTLHTSLLFTVF